MWEIAGYPVGSIVRNCGLHFLLGFVAAWLVCWLILTIFGVEEARIRFYSLLLAVSLSIILHVLQDYFVGWF